MCVMLNWSQHFRLEFTEFTFNSEFIDSYKNYYKLCPALFAAIFENDLMQRLFVFKQFQAFTNINQSKA